ncbi:MAG: SpoIIE family protein phosphatase [Halioglobus sp.]
MRNSISTRLIVLLTLALAVILGGGMLLDYRISREEILTRLSEEAAVEVSVAVSDMENWLNGIEATTRLLGRILEQREYSQEGLQQMLRDVVANNDEIFGAAIAVSPEFTDDSEGFSPYYFLDDGTVSYADLANARADYQQQPWFKEPIAAGKAVWTEPYYDAGGGEVNMTTFAVPVYRIDDNGNRFLYAVVTADVTLAALQRVAGQLHLGESSYSLLFSKEGLMMSTRTQASVMEHYSVLSYQDVNLDSWHQMFSRALLGEPSTYRFPCPESAGQCTIRLGRLKTTGWPIGLVYSQEEILSPLHQYEVKILLLGVSTLLLMAITVYLVTSRLTRPLQQLSSATAHMAKGELDVALPQATGKDEVSTLVRSFNSMNRDLKAYINDLETATANKSRLEGELAAAREIQMSMLPGSGEALWQDDDISLWAKVRPAKTVGGDLYTYFLGEKHLFIAVGDVSDKGVAAALFMARAISLIQQLSGTAMPPDKAMAELNNALERDNHSCMFVTLFLGVLEISSGQLRFASAGHTAPSLLRAGKVTTVDQETGPALGLADNQFYPINTLQLLRGDRLAVYTDGIDEAFNDQQEMYGVDRFNQEFQASGELPIAEAGLQLFNSVDTYTGELPQSDDITLLLLQYPKVDEFRETEAFDLGDGLTGRVQSWLGATLEKWSIALETVMEFDLVAEELVTNVQKYSGLEADQLLQMTVIKTANSLVLELRDQGKAFNPFQDGHRSKLGADIESAEIGGLGVHLVTQLTDQQNYRRENECNVLRVEKTIAGQDNDTPA